MTLDKRHSNTLLSLVILIIWTGLVFLIAYPSRNAPTNDFGVIIYCILTLFVGLATGIVALIFRFLKSIKDKSNFFYNFIGTLNICLGIVGLALAALNQLDKPWVILFAFSLFIGIFIMSDIYIKPHQKITTTR